MGDHIKLSKPIAIISSRVPPEVYKILESKARERGMNLSQLVRYILTSVALGLDGVNISNINQPIIVNVNINKNEVSPTFNNNVNARDEVVEEYIRMLESEISMLKKVLKRKNKEIKELKQKLEVLKKLAEAGDIRNIRKVLKLI